MALIKGMDVVLVNMVETGLDPFGNPMYEETETTVHNVLVAPLTADDLVTGLDLDGTKEVYRLGLQKGDNHIWEHQIVRFWGKSYKVFSPVYRGIEANVPTPWHHIYYCERYE